MPNRLLTNTPEENADARWVLYLEKVNLHGLSASTQRLIQTTFTGGYAVGVQDGLTMAEEIHNKGP